MILVRGHLADGVNSSLIYGTTCLTVGGSLIWFHFESTCRTWRYSLRHQLQKSFRILVAWRYVVGVNLSETGGSGTDNKVSSIRKCPGVNTRAFWESALSWVSGLEFKQASIRTSNVVVSSNVRVDWPIIWRWWCFVDFTSASQIFPKYGADDGIKIRFVPSWTGTVAHFRKLTKIKKNEQETVSLCFFFS